MKTLQKIVSVVAVLVATIVSAQTPTENYVKTTVYQTEVQEGQQSQVLESDKIESINYYDDLGRPKQSVAVRAGGQQQGTNILDWTDDWKVGTGATPLFNLNGQSSDNQRIFDSNPFGEQSLLWRCGNDSNNDADGGWNTDYIPVNKDVAYRYTVWVKRTGSQDGKTYHGTQNVDNLNGTANNNPYFWSGDMPNLNQWYLLVGVIHPHTYSGNNSGISGVYDVNGNKVRTANDFKWRNNTTTSRFRSYLYYATDTSVRQYFWNPVLTKIDGNGVPVSELIQQTKPKDIITHYEYDDFGRQTKSYLPYASDQTANGDIHADALSELKAFYNTPKYENTLNPYSETITEISPLSRSLETAAPGTPWQYSKNNQEYKDPVYVPFPNTATYSATWFANEIFYNDGTDSGDPTDDNDPILIDGRNFLTIEIANNQLRLEADLDQTSGGTTIQTGKLRYMNIYPMISYFDLGTIKDKNGNDTDYHIYIQDNHLVIDPTTTNPILTNGIAMDVTYNLSQLQVLSDYSESYSTNHTTKASYQLNEANEVVRFDVRLENGIPTLIKNGHYTQNQLSKSVVKNENWTVADGSNRTSETFTDKNGNVVLSRAYNNGQAHDTYNVYDDFGNLTYVIPPKVTIDNGVSATELTELCYQYKYDDRNRLIEKRIPGKGLEYIIYNKLDQPVMTQDAKQRARDEWSFTKYDAFGRVAFTGIHKHPGTVSRVTMQGFSDTGNYTQYVTKQSAASTIAGTSIYYSNDAIPTGIHQVLTIHYYDDYEVGDIVTFNPANGGGTWEGMTTTTNVKGLPTVAQVRVLGTNQWITTATYYDERGRAWETHVKNEYLGTDDWVLNQLDFTGKVLKTLSRHTKSGTTITTIDRFTYDHMGRLLTQKQQINDQAEELLSQLVYDDLGQLVQKKVGNAEQAPLQTIDYTYNIRGWLTNINDVDAMGDDLFSYKINYHTVEGYYDVPALYNGNISQVVWKSATDNIKRSYSYQYDDLDRITSANSLKGNTLMSGDAYSIWGIAYDKNGNIGRITRNGRPDGGAIKIIDELYYTYSNNKLLKVREAITTVYKDEGFKDGTNTNEDYEYDVNGNMTIDRNKGITDIAYNHLDLPVNVQIDGKNITYTYDATGVKQRKIVNSVIGVAGKETSYAGKYLYESSLGGSTQLKLIHTTEGYVEPESDGTFTYIYQHKDHLGNNRLNYSDKDHDGHIDVLRNDTTDLDGDGDYAHEILQENNYYPFGLQHKGYNTQITGQEHQYKYNGTELTQELGLNWYEMPLRSYDPAIARWNRIDPVVHHGLSPYNAFDNNPVFYSDPSGGNSEYGYTTGGRHFGGSDFFAQVDYERYAGFLASGHLGINYGSDIEGGLAAAGFRPDNNSIVSKGDLSNGIVETDPWAKYFGAKVAEYDGILNVLDPLGQIGRGYKDSFFAPFKALEKIFTNPSSLLKTPDVENTVSNSLQQLPGGRLGMLGINFMSSAMTSDFYGMGSAYGREAGQLTLDASLTVTTSGLGQGASYIGRGISRGYLAFQRFRTLPFFGNQFSRKIVGNTLVDVSTHAINQRITRSFTSQQYLEIIRYGTRTIRPGRALGTFQYHYSFRGNTIVINALNGRGITVFSNQTGTRLGLGAGRVNTF